MLNQLPFAMITVQRAIENEMRSALPGAPVVDAPAPHTRPRSYRTRAAFATRLARVADAVAPSGWAPSREAASSR